MQKKFAFYIQAGNDCRFRNDRAKKKKCTFLQRVSMPAGIDTENTHRWPYQDVNDGYFDI